MACDSLIQLAWQAARRMNFHRPMYTGQGPDDGRQEAVAVIVEMFGDVFSEVEQLRAEVDRLPRAADGERVIPTVDQLYLPFWGKVGVLLTYKDSNGREVSCSVKDCYTKPHDSREAAQAAGGE